MQYETFKPPLFKINGPAKHSSKISEPQEMAKFVPSTGRFSWSKYQWTSQLHSKVPTVRQKRIDTTHFNFAKQFTHNAPFLLIFAFDYLFSNTIHVNVANCSSTLFRSLCRRAFVQFKADTNTINSIGKGYAKNIDGTTKLRDVAKLLSGVLLVNIQNNQSWLYTNPNAKNRLSRYHLEQIFDFAFSYNMDIDNFRHEYYWRLGYTAQQREVAISSRRNCRTLYDLKC